MSVDSITDLDDNQSRLLEALQLSLPAEAQSKKEKARDKKLSLNPIYRQVPRLVDSCCQHLEKHGKNFLFSWERQIYFYYNINVYFEKQTYASDCKDSFESQDTFHPVLPLAKDTV